MRNPYATNADSVGTHHDGNGMAALARRRTSRPERTYAAFLPCSIYTFLTLQIDGQDVLVQEVLVVDLFGQGIDRADAQVLLFVLRVQDPGVLGGIEGHAVVPHAEDDLVLGSDSQKAFVSALNGRPDFTVHMYCGYGHTAYDFAPDFKERMKQFFLREDG